MQPLFISPELTFEKVATETDLADDPNQWPQEILQELYKQVPYIGNFDPKVTMERVDSERGYGLGNAVITNKTEAQNNTNPEAMEAAGIRTVRIPIVIKAKKLSPFDLLVNDSGNVLPLTETRLNQSLFRPQMFDVTSQTPGDQSTISQLYPPYRQNYGFGGGSMGMSVGMGKQSSALEDMLVAELEARDPGFRKVQVKTASARVKFRKTASLLHTLGSTFYAADIENFFDKLSSDLTLQAAYTKNRDSIIGSVGILAHQDTSAATKLASAIEVLSPPDVTQITRSVSGYVVKTACSNDWNPTTSLLTRTEAVRAYGPKVVLAADESGQVTVADGATASEPEPTTTVLDTEQPAPVTKSGLYKVRDASDGKELIGFVVPNLIDLDGTPLPLALFTNGSHSALQPDILGTSAGSGTTLPTGPISGVGSFFSYTATGELQATVPFELTGGSYSTPGEPTTYSGTTFDGRPVEVSVQPNIQTLIQTEEGKVLIPERWQWVPLGVGDAVSLVGGDDSEGDVPEDWHDAAEDWSPEEGDLDEESEEEPEETKQGSYVILRGAEDSYDFSGPGVAKLGSFIPLRNLNVDDAMFLLAGLGVDQRYGIRKLAHAMNEPQRVVTGRHIVPSAVQEKRAMARAEKLLPVAGMLRRDLMKEAAAIQDPTAVDTVLSLGFINPENIMSFASFLPTIEEAQLKLCDLLLAARVGIGLSVPSLERSIRSVEEVIQGLKILAFSDN